MLTCPRCMASIPEGASICGACGAPVEAIVSAAASPAPTGTVQPASTAPSRQGGPASALGLAAFLAPAGRAGGARPEECVCAGCGAQQKVDLQATSVTCNTCGVSYVLDDSPTLGEGAPFGRGESFLLPFTTRKQQFWESMLNWLIAGDSTPSGLLEEASFEAVQGIYYPYYHLRYAFKAEWSAEIGRYQSVVDFYAWENSPTVFGDKEKASRRRTQAIMHWADETGETSGAYLKTVRASDSLPDTLVEGVMRSSRITHHIVTLLPPRPELLEGFRQEAFKPTIQDVSEICLKQDLPNYIAKRVNQEMPGDSQRNCAIKDQAKPASYQKIYLPFWYAKYSYKGRTYAVLADGQQAHDIVGNKPVDVPPSEKAKVNAKRPWRALAAWAIASVVALPAMWLLSSWIGPSATGSEGGSVSLLALVALLFLLAILGLGWIPAVALFTLGQRGLRRSIEQEHSKRQDLVKKLLAAGPPSSL